MLTFMYRSTVKTEKLTYSEKKKPIGMCITCSGSVQSDLMAAVVLDGNSFTWWQQLYLVAAVVLSFGRVHQQ